MVDACEHEQTSLLHQYVLNKTNELAENAQVNDSSAGPHSISPFVPCASSRIPYILQAARLTKDDVLYDLGCGDGIILHEAALRYGCRCVGLDIDSACLRIARERATELGIAHLCRWMQCDLLALPPGTLSSQEGTSLPSDEAQDPLPPATVALVFLTASGLVKLSTWLHEEWRKAARALRVLTCVESLDTVMDPEDPAGVLAEPNPLGWPVCHDHARWGVFVVPPFEMSIAEWQQKGASPLRFSRSEAEATAPIVIRNFLSPEEVGYIDSAGRALLAARPECSDESALSLFDLGADGDDRNFHAAIEDAMHSLPEHQILHLHGLRGAFETYPGLKEAEKKLIEAANSNDQWGLLRHRQVNVRSFEYHAYCSGGSVLDPEHRDDGSLVTMSVLLSPPSSFSGGRFVTWQHGDRVAHDLAQGDAILFVSEKRHNVETVQGDRRALIIELWDGPRNQHNRHI